MFFSNSLVSIDIGSSAVKMLELTGNITQRKLKNFAIEVLPRGLIENSLINDADALTQIVKKMVNKLGVKGRRVSISVSGSGVIIKRVRVAIGKDATLAEQVDFHAAQSFQVDLSELYYDYADLGPSPRHEGHVDVLLVGARRELIEQQISIVKAAGLSPGVIEAAAISAANMFELNYGVVDGLIALVSVGASQTEISFIDNGRFLYSFESPIGGETYTSAIVQAMNMDRETAEALKISISENSGDVSSEIQRVLNETNNLIVNDIRQIFGFFAASSDAEGVAAAKFVFLAGGASRTLGLDAAIASALGIPVVFANPFQRVEVNERKFKIEQVLSLSPMFAVAIGLGIREKGDKVPV
jgi:type IV pilus assembly protein PilM